MHGVTNTDTTSDGNSEPLRRRVTLIWPGAVPPDVLAAAVAAIPADLEPDGRTRPDIGYTEITVWVVGRGQHAWETAYAQVAPASAVIGHDFTTVSTGHVLLITPHPDTDGPGP